MIRAKKEDVTIRNFLQEDITPLVNYWTKNSAEFWKARGLDKSKLMSESEFTDFYLNAFRKYGDVKTVAVILYKNKAIGVHTLTDFIENESAIFHAHIWNEEHRKIGIGNYSYIKAADFFMKKLNLKKIIFKSPKINLGANRIKEKLGIPCLGDTVFESPVLFAPIQANLYELDIELLEKIKAKTPIAEWISKVFVPVSRKIKTKSPISR